jgi:hypothetical protein
MKEYLKTIELLEKNNFYKIADRLTINLIRLAAYPYNLSALDELPLSARNVSWEHNKEDYQQYDDNFYKEFKQRIPEYMNMNTDKDEETNMEGKLTGQPDSVPGPAYNLPGEEGVSPSQSTLGDFDWDTIRNTNNDPSGWTNLQPRR